MLVQLIWLKQLAMIYPVRSKLSSLLRQTLSTFLMRLAFFMAGSVNLHQLSKHSRLRVMVSGSFSCSTSLNI